MNTAEEHKKIKLDQQLYKKVGKKYVSVSDPYALDGLREGTYLVEVRRGSTSIRQHIWPANAEVEAALLKVENAMCHAICEASKCKPSKDIKYSKKFLAAYKKFAEEVKDEPCTTLWGASIADAVQAGLAVVRPEAEKAVEERARRDNYYMYRST